MLGRRKVWRHSRTVFSHSQHDAGVRSERATVLADDAICWILWLVHRTLKMDPCVIKAGPIHPH
jgi:hypothetical protein